MRKRFFISLSLLSLVLVVAYNACSETHFTTVQNTTIAGNPFAPASNEVMYAICGEITKCNSTVTISGCQSAVLAAGGMAAKLGLSDAAYPTFADVFQAEQSNVITGNAAAAGDCYSSISALSCSSPLVQQAYNPTLSNPYSGLSNIFPTTSTCSSVFAATYSYYLYVALNGANRVAGYSVNTADGSLTATPNGPYATGTGTGVYHVMVEKSGHFAYACNENTSDVTPYAVNQTTGELTPLSANIATAGSGCHYVAGDAQNRFIYVTNDNSNQISGFSLNTDGSLSPMASPMSFVNPHTVIPDLTGNFLFIPDFSATGVTAATIRSDGTLASNGSQAAGSLPSQGAVTPDNQFLYVTDFGGTDVYGYKINGTTGQLSPPIGNWSSGPSTCPHSMAIEPTGKYGYVANVCSTTITVFSIGSDGTLTNVQTVTAGNSPHTVVVDPTGQYVYATDSGSGEVSGFKINSSDGTLTPLSWSPMNVGANPLGLSIGKIPK